MVPEVIRVILRKGTWIIVHHCWGLPGKRFWVSRATLSRWSWNGRSLSGNNCGRHISWALLKRWVWNSRSLCYETGSRDYIIAVWGYCCLGPHKLVELCLGKGTEELFIGVEVPQARGFLVGRVWRCSWNGWLLSDDIRTETLHCHCESPETKVLSY